MATQWYDHLGSPPLESYNISQNLTLHILEGGIVKDKKGRTCPSNYKLLRDFVGEDIPEFVLKRIDHHLAIREGDKQAERIRLAMEKAAAAEREAIRLEELEAERKTKKEKEDKVLEEPEVLDDDEDDDEDFENLEVDLTGPSPKKKTAKKAKK